MRLLPVTPAVLEALGSPAVLLREHAASVPFHADLVRDALRQSLDFHARVGAHAPWTGYLALDDGGAAFGTCGFKGDPSPRAEVEISYFTLPRFEGRGGATSMARAMLDMARASGVVRRVLAHTLPERNASCRVLEKCGLRFAGEVLDPEDGRVWRWQVDLAE